MTVSGRSESITDQVLSYGLMGACTKVNGVIVEKMEEENLQGEMVQYMKENGSKVNTPAEENFKHLMEKYLLVHSKMANFQVDKIIFLITYVLLLLFKRIPK